MTTWTSTLLNAMAALALVALLSVESKAADQAIQPAQLASAGATTQVDDQAAAALRAFLVAQRPVSPLAAQAAR